VGRSRVCMTNTPRLKLSLKKISPASESFQERGIKAGGVAFSYVRPGMFLSSPLQFGVGKSNCLKFSQPRMQGLNSPILSAILSVTDARWSRSVPIATRSIAPISGRREQNALWIGVKDIEDMRLSNYKCY
jgi:hypothetical protein